MTRPGPNWLAELQARFGEAIRRPLDRRDGVLRARGGELAIYNRQYWLRLFEAFQGAYPLTCRLVGAWTFNQLAERFLEAHPPSGWDLEQSADGFERHLAEGELPASVRKPEALVEAARIDAAWRNVLRAPEVAPLKLGPADSEGFAERRLIRTPSVAWVTEHWPLLELRRTTSSASLERALELPPRFPHCRHFALLRQQSRIVQLPLEPLEAELLSMLDDVPIGEALARLESACPEETRGELPARAQAWLGRGMQLGFWIALS